MIDNDRELDGLRGKKLYMSAVKSGNTQRVESIMLAQDSL